MTSPSTANKIGIGVFGIFIMVPILFSFGVILVAGWSTMICMVTGVPAAACWLPFIK